MILADIHNHSLFGVDDGPASLEAALALLGESHRDGVRYICLTPHCFPGCFGDNHRQVTEAFGVLKTEAEARYPDLHLILGNELRYAQGCTGWLQEGWCRTMGGTDYVLVDFSELEKEKSIERGLERLLNAGYRPILAHAERYRNLDAGLKKLREFRDNGVLIQIDAQALFGRFGLRAKMQAKSLLRQGMADFVSSDAHDLTRRPPAMESAYRYILKKYGQPCADAVCGGNALGLFFK